LNWDARNAEACANKLDELEISVFFPTLGLMRADASLTRIHPNYVSRGRQRTRLHADLAVIRLNRTVPLAPDPIPDRIDATLPLLSSGFGMLNFSVVGEDSPFEALRTYQEGAKQVAWHGGVQPSTPDLVGTNRNPCGPAAAGDYLCTFYTASRVSEGVTANTALCGGDSGSPLFSVSADSHFLIGIATGRAGSDECAGETPTFSYFIDLTNPIHRDWVASVVASGDNSAVPAVEYRDRCGEQRLTGPAAIETLAPYRFMSITTFRERDNETAFRPSVSVADAQGFCDQDSTAGITTCAFETPRKVALRVSEGFGQVVFCE
jgi:hypothetical protein